LVQKHPIRILPQEKIAAGDNAGDPYFYVPNLKEVFIQSYAGDRLPPETAFD
jgi:hypothetical protein